MMFVSSSASRGGLTGGGLMLLFLAAPVWAQAAAEQLTVAPDVGPPSASAVGPPPPARAGMGRSGEVNVVLAQPASEISPAILAAMGGGWDLGHHWSRLGGRSRDGLLGVPIVPSRAASDQGTVDVGITVPSEAGVWQLESGSGARLTVITQVPASLTRSGRLNGYFIGIYPTAGSARTDAYAPPRSFVEVTPDNRELPVSRHLTLGQFLTKDQFDVWPKYVALDTRLLDKLELVLQELNGMGVRAERLYVMSGYRTPQYNGPGGDGRAALSRHMWGDAADVWVDNDGNGLMDDLNGDGSVDIDDAAIMMRAVDRVERKYPELIGGAGTYPTTPAHGPFIHIDARGHHARW